MAMTYSALQMEVKERAIRNQGGTEFDSTVKNTINSCLLRIARDSLWRPLRRFGKVTTVTTYSTGTGAVSVTNGLKTFSVVGATFLSDSVQIGRKISFGTDSSFYIVESFTSETAGTITEAYRGTTSTATSYSILPQEEYNLPIQAGPRCFIYHNDFGYPYKMTYITDQDFRDCGLIDTNTGIPLAYRMWGENWVISQPVAPSVVRVYSSSSSDQSKSITVFGTVSGYPDYEVINTDGTNGTTPVSGSKSFSSIERIVKANSTLGRISVDANSANTLIAVMPVGDTTTGIKYSKIQLWPLPDSVFDLEIQYYKDPYRLVNDGDVHELGEQFDEAIILLSTAKIRYQNSEKEGDNFIKLYSDEIKSLRRTNVDKIDWAAILKRPNESRVSPMARRFLNYMQIGGSGSFGPQVYQ